MIQRLVHLSDLHLMENARLEIAAGVLFRLANQIADRASCEPLSAILITGDLSGRDAPHQSTSAERTILATFFRKLSNIAPVVIIRGNHDRKSELAIYERCSLRNPIFAFDEQNCIVPDGLVPMGIFVLPWAPLRSFGHDLGALTRDDANDTVLARLEQRWRVFVNGISVSTAHVIAAHFPVRNATVGSFEIQSSRDVLIHPSWLDQTGAAYVALGHVHQPQRVSENAWYAGSPYPVDFSETFRHSYNWVEIEDGKANVECVPIESWNMVTLYGIWNRDGMVSDPLWVGDDEGYRIGRTQLDDAHVRLMLKLEPFMPLESIPLDAIQSYILRCGGTLDRKDIHISRTAVGQGITPEIEGTHAWSLQERIRDRIGRRDDSAEMKQRLLDLVALIG